MRESMILLVALGACHREPGPGRFEAPPPNPGTACQTEADCPPDRWCLHQQCVLRPLEAPPPGDTDLPRLTVTPATLSFGVLAPPERKTLALVVANTGTSMLTLSGVEVVPADAPFIVESTGFGPFWVRPGRSREIFLTFAPVTTTAVRAQLRIESAAPPATVDVVGN